MIVLVYKSVKKFLCCVYVILCNVKLYNGRSVILYLLEHSDKSQNHWLMLSSIVTHV